MTFSKDSKSAGSNKRLDNIAINNVIETNHPKATVPPKSDSTKTKKPKNKTTDV